MWVGEVWLEPKCERPYRHAHRRDAVCSASTTASAPTISEALRSFPYVPAARIRAGKEYRVRATAGPADGDPASWPATDPAIRHSTVPRPMAGTLAGHDAEGDGSPSPRP